MAQRSHVPTATRRALVQEAGGKCANPGCSNALTELHHIQEWAVYRTHDAEHMIAVCSACHDQVDRGELRINDETLYAWKQIERRGVPRRDHLYIEPGDDAKLLLGTIAVKGAHGGLLAFDLSPHNRLAFALRDGDVFLLNLAVADRRGEELVRVVDGHVKAPIAAEVEFERRTGRVRLTAPVQGRYLPARAVEMLRAQEPGFAASGRLSLLDVEVLEPGLVRVQGVWTRGLDAIVVTRERLAFVSPSPERREPVSLMGEGAASVLHFTGPVTSALFNMGPTEQMPRADQRQRSVRVPELPR